MSASRISIVYGVEEERPVAGLGDPISKPMCLSWVVRGRVKRDEELGKIIYMLIVMSEKA